MPSIETITASDIVIPSRVALRDRRSVVDTKLETPAPPAIAVARPADKVVPPPPVAAYRTTDAVSLATLFNTSAPVALDADAIEDEIAKILALLESDSADGAPADALDADPAPNAGPAPKEATARLPPPLPPQMASPPLPVPPDAISLEPMAADDVPLVATDTVEPPPSPQPPASPTEVATRLANLIADHKSLLEEFAAATEHLGVTDFTDDAPDLSLVAPDHHPPLPLPVEADHAQPAPLADRIAFPEEADIPPPIIPVAPVPAWSSAAEASRANRGDPAAESLVRAIAAAQSYVPLAPPAPPQSAKSTQPGERIDVALPQPDRLPYTAPSDPEPARLNPVPGFLGGVAVSGIVGAALWAALQA